MKYLGSGRKHKKSKSKSKSKASSSSSVFDRFELKASSATQKRLSKLSEESSKAPSPSPSPSSINARKIQKFMRITQRKRKGAFLKAICSDSGECISLGKERDKIKEFFNGFTKFQYVLPPIKRVGTISENGFINEIIYKKDNYISRAILKSARHAYSDNLMYEYLAGQYINDKCKKFPCFLETYGMYKYKGEISWTLLRQPYTSTNILPSKLQLLTEIDLGIGCRNSKYLAILIQHIQNPISLEQALGNTASNKRFFEYMLLPILFQIYTPLAIMKNEYTHYDLHLENILLYEAPNDGYFECHYVMPDSTNELPHIIHFKTKYIPKIIDYGRSFFFKSDIENSVEIYDDLCDTAECVPDCGSEKGFSWLETMPYPEDRFYINSSKRNMTHDLRLLQHFESLHKDTFDAINHELNSIIHSINYSSEYGSKEILDSGLPDSINNVEDAFLKFTECMEKPIRHRMNIECYQGKPKIGDIYVYCNSDKNMEYTSAA